MSTRPLAIEASHISFHYPCGQQALNDISLEIPHGSFVAFIAANGSGKTTLFKALTHLIRPNTGNILIHGKDIRQWSKSELYQTVGLVFQNPTDQLFCATVMDDIAFGPRNLGLSEPVVQERVTEAIKAVGACNYANRPIEHLSFGEQKRVAIAGVLAMRPPIIILDEPTAGLDPSGERSMLELLHSLNQQGITIIISTHAVDLLPEFVDSVYVLHRGQLLAHGPPVRILQDRETLEKSSLRMPYLSYVFDDLKTIDQVPITTLPVTQRQAIKCIRDWIVLPPPSIAHTP